MTCIGNTGPLIPEVSKAINENNLAVTAVLSGNRNFEGRISPDVKMNYLASPPLVIVYALAGTMNIDLATEPVGQGSEGQDVFLADLWPSAEEIEAVVGSSINSEMFASRYADVFNGDDEVTVVVVGLATIVSVPAGAIVSQRVPTAGGAPGTS